MPLHISRIRCWGFEPKDRIPIFAFISPWGHRPFSGAAVAKRLTAAGRAARPSVTTRPHCRCYRLGLQRVERSESGEPGEFERMSDEELKRFILEGAQALIDACDTQH
jgi:hypothetical protein